MWGAAIRRAERWITGGTAIEGGRERGARSEERGERREERGERAGCAGLREAGAGASGGTRAKLSSSTTCRSSVGQRPLPLPLARARARARALLLLRLRLLLPLRLLSRFLFLLARVGPPPS
eukprot:3940590-Rhodomonas_salina.6